MKRKKKNSGIGDEKDLYNWRKRHIICGNNFRKKALFADYAKRFHFDLSEIFSALDAVDTE